MQIDSNLAGAEVAQLDYSTLVRVVMKARNISANRLLKDRVIRKCTSRGFSERLGRGQITTAELNALFAYLEIDPVRATLALFCLQDPNAYFDPSCETASSLASETVIALTEQLAACDGIFQPIRQTLCRALAQRTSGMIVEHHRRVEEVREATIS